MEMLTSLSFLDKGEEWPPHSQTERLKKYADNRKRFKNKLGFDRKKYNHIISLVGNKFRVIDYKFLVNFYKKVSLKTSDLLFVEPPTISAGDDETKNTVIEQIKDLSDLDNIGAQAAIDASRYVDALLTIRIPSADDEETQAQAYIGITSPLFWFPVTSPMNLKEITQHVIAWTSTETIIENGKEKEVTYLDYQIHYKGHYERGRKYVEKGTIGDAIFVGQPVEVEDEEGVIGKQVSELERVDTGLSSFAIIPAQNVVTSDTIFAIDDYDDFASLVEELQVRLEKIAHVLDKHADPSLSGPTSALTYDEETGEWFLKMGDYYHRNSKEDPAVEYVTWDGKLESSFQEIELLLDLIAVLSEMGSAIFDRDSLKGSGLSGRALRLLYVNPLTKVRRIRNRFDRSFKEAIALCSEVGYEGKSVEKKDISIKWNDGLPNDKKEDAEIGVIRTGGKATDTIVAQIMEQDGLTKEDAEAKYAEIVKETNARLLSEEPEPNFFEDEEDEGEGEEI